MKVWLIAVMIVLAFMAVDITVRIEWDRFISGIGSLVDGQRHAEQVNPDIAQPRTTPPRLETRLGDTASHQGNRGYKDFSWGDDVIKVKSKVPDLGSRFSMDLNVAVLAVYSYQYGYLYETSIPSLLSEIEGKRDTFWSESSQTYFEFLEGKLFVVSLFFASESPLPSLEKKYGTVKPRVITMLLGEITTRVWFEEKDRIIVHYIIIGFEGVTYLDSKVYNKAAARLVQKRKTESQDSLKRID